LDGIRGSYGKTGQKCDNAVGTMFKLLRPAGVAGGIAGTAELFTFGTNSGTGYIAQEIVKLNSFAFIDVQGVGQLMQSLEFAVNTEVIPIPPNFVTGEI
jgi:hypothetical protein